jgi:hypothetical protein
VIYGVFPNSDASISVMGLGLDNYYLDFEVVVAGCEAAELLICKGNLHSK